jgi:hypothetical protein
MGVTVTDDSPVIAENSNPAIVVGRTNTVIHDQENYVVCLGANETLVIPDVGNRTITASADSLVNFAGGAQGPQGIQGVIGNPGGPGTATLMHVFSWGDAQPQTLFVANDGGFIAKVEVIITTPFDAHVTLSVGYSADHERLMFTDENDPSALGTYQSNPNYRVSGSTAIVFYKTLIGNVSAGSGTLFIYYEA